MSGERQNDPSGALRGGSKKARFLNNSNARLSVLAVTSELPWPLDSGGHLRTHHLLRSLASRFHVRLVVPFDGRHSAELSRAMELARLDTRLVVVPPRMLLREAVKVVTAGLTAEPYVMFARHRHRLIRQALRDEVKRRRPDVVYLDHLDSLVYASVAAEIPVVLDMHNVYSRLASRAAAEARGWPRRAYLAREAVLLARTERRAVRTVHTVLAVSDDDASCFTDLGAARVAVVPNGVDYAAYDHLPLAQRSGPPTILYVGSLRWPPNVAAARVLATEVLPAVRRRLPDVRLKIVGRNPAPEIEALARADEQVEVVGNVREVVSALRDAHVLAVPLEAGGGTRVKILEAFAGGLPVVSTPMGCEGLGVVDGEHLVVAQRTAFPAAIVALLGDPGRARALAARARQFARARYNWSVVGARACEALAWATTRGHGDTATLTGLALQTRLSTQ